MFHLNAFFGNRHTHSVRAIYDWIDIDFISVTKMNYPKIGILHVTIKKEVANVITNV